MTTSNSTNPLESTKTSCDSTALTILRVQATANVFNVIIGTLGLWGASTILFTYGVFRDFRYKSYFLLGCLATANLVDCMGLVSLATLRLIQLIACADPSMSRRTCLLILAPYWTGYTASIAFDFIVAIDRSIYLFAPRYYRHRLGSKYAAVMVAGALVPAVCIETPSFVYWTNRTTQQNDDDQFVQVCSEGDPNIRSSAHTIADYVNVVLVLATASVYLVLASQSKRPIVRKAELIVSQTSVPRELSYHMSRFVLMQRRVMRVSVASAISSLLTNGTFLVSKLVMEYYLPKEEMLMYAPYVALPLLLNNAGAVLFSLWRDRVFRRRFRVVMKSCYGSRRGVVREFKLGLSVSVLDKKF